jgi:hypothetical protein
LKKVFDMKRTMLCREVMVEIVKENIEPKWGLYNGAIGTVVYIVYHQGVKGKADGDHKTSEQPCVHRSKTHTVVWRN